MNWLGKLDKRTIRGTVIYVDRWIHYIRRGINKSVGQFNVWSIWLMEKCCVKWNDKQGDYLEKYLYPLNYSFHSWGMD